jgi:hypothetical protein
MVPFEVAVSASAGALSSHRARLARSISRTRSSWIALANSSKWNIPHLVLAAIQVTASLTRGS